MGFCRWNVLGARFALPDFGWSASCSSISCMYSSTSSVVFLLGLVPLVVRGLLARFADASCESLQVSPNLHWSPLVKKLQGLLLLSAPGMCLCLHLSAHLHVPNLLK